MSNNYNLLCGLMMARNKARGEDDATHAVPIKQSMFSSIQLFFAAVLFLLLGATGMNAQTTEIDPAGDGGFESGIGSWQTANDVVNKWYVGSGATPSTGSKCAYISNTGGATNTYTMSTGSNGISVERSFIYHTVTVPAGETKIDLSFDWKCLGRYSTSLASQDAIQVYIAPTSLSLTPGLSPYGGAIQISPLTTSALGLQLNYKRTTYSIPSSYAGTTFNVIFSFSVVSSTSAANAMAAAIDNVSMVSRASATVTSVKSGVWSDPTVWSSGTVPQNENVTIAAGHTVSIDVVGENPILYDYMIACASAYNLTVNGTLNFTSTGVNFMVNNNLTVNSGGQFNAYYWDGVTNTATAKVYKDFYVKGNLTNNGSMDIFSSTIYMTSNNVVTAGGNGVFANDPTTSPVFTTTMFLKTLALRNSNPATPNVNWGLDTRVWYQLELKKARVQLGTKTFTQGINPTQPWGTITANYLNQPVTEDAGFMPGNKFVRYWTATQTGYIFPATGDFTTSTYTKYPFVNANGENRSVYLFRATAGALAGEVGVVYNDVAGYTTLAAPVADGTTIINSRTNSNWVVTGTGTGNTLWQVALEAPGTYIPLSTSSTAVARVMKANSVFGTNGIGPKLPIAVRTNFLLSEIDGQPLYVGAADSDVVSTTAVTSVATGNWNSASTWAGGHIPTATDNVIIAAGTTVTVNSTGNVSENLTVYAGGTLVQASGDLTVGTTLKNNELAVSGTLTVSGGTLYINGNSVFNLFSNFNQSGGNINVDGNDGTLTNSVLTGVPLMKISATNPSNLQWTGGTLTFVNPHAGQSATENVLLINQYGDDNEASANHTVQFGDGTSTIPAGYSDGFKFTIKPDATSYLSMTFGLGSVHVNAGAALNRNVRFVASNADLNVMGNLTIDPGSVFAFVPKQPTQSLYLAGNLTNNGTFVNTSILNLQIAKRYYQTPGSSGSGSAQLYFVPVPTAQTISGNGQFLNTLGLVPSSCTGLNLTTGLTVNNSSASGVTLSTPLVVASAAGTATGLTLIKGKVNTDATNVLTVGSPICKPNIDVNGASGVLINGYVNGPLAQYIAAGNTSSNYVYFPVGKSAAMPFFIAPTTTATNLVTVQAFENNTVTVNASSGKSVANAGRWSATSTLPLGVSSVKFGDAIVAQGMIPVQSATATGTYTAAFGNKSVFIATNTNLIQSNQTANALNYFSYANNPDCTGTAVTGNASIKGVNNGTPAYNDTTVGYNDPFTLTLPDAIITGGLTYQWETSSDNVTYTSITGATTLTVITTQTAASAYYRCRVTCGPTTLGSGVVSGYIHTSIPQSSLAGFVLTPASGVICAGSTASISTGSTGGTYMFFDAAVGGNEVISVTGSSASVTTPILNATTTYWVGALDASGLQTQRSPITITVKTIPAAPTAAAQTFCQSETVASLTATGTNLNWYTAATGGTAQTSNTALLAGTNTYYVSQNPLGCEGPRAAVVVTYVAAPAQPGAQSTCNSATVANLVITGSNVKWYNASIGGYQWSSTDLLVAGNYFASQTVNGCETQRTPVVVNAGTTLPVAPTITTPQALCDVFGSPSTLATLAITSGTSIKWYDALTGGNFVPSTTLLTTTPTSYYASQTVTGCESTARTLVVASIQTVLAPVAAAAQSFCGNSTVGNIVTTSNPSSANATAFNCYLNATDATSAVLTSSTKPVNGNTYYISQTVGGCESVARTPVTVAYYDVPAPVIGSQSVCTGATYGSIPVSGLLTNATVNWYNGNTVAATLLSSGTAVVAGTIYAAQVVGGCESFPTTRATATMTVVASPSAPTVAAQSFATGATVANLVATGTTGTVKWYDAASAGNLLPSTTVLMNNGTYYASQTTGCESPISTVSTVTLTDAVAAPTATSPQIICGTSGAVSTLIVTGLTGATFKWYTTPTGGVPTTASLVSGNYYYASQIVGGVESTTRAQVLVKFNNTSLSGFSGYPGSQTVCTGTTLASINLLQYQSPAIPETTLVWYSDSGATFVVPSTTVIGSTTYYAKQLLPGIGTACQAQKATVVFTTTATQAATPTGNTAPFMATGSTLADLTVTGTAGATIQWYATVGGTLLPSTTPIVSGTTYYATQLVAGSCESAALAVTPTLCSSGAAPAATALQNLCAGATVANLTATIAPTDTARWYTTATGGQVLASTTALISGTYYVSDATATCETARTPVLVSLNAPAAPVVGATQTLCGTPSTVANLSPGQAGFNWYSAATGGTALVSTAPVNTATAYYVSAVVGSCESTTRTKVTVTVSSIPAGPTVSNQAVCTSGTVALASSLKPVLTKNATNWYTASSGGNPMLSTDALVSGNTYYVTTVAAGCESARLSSVVTVAANPAAPIVSSSPQIVCGATTTTISLSGLPSGSWTISPGSIAGSGSTYTVTGVTGSTTAKQYSVTDSNLCVSGSSMPVLINTMAAAPVAPTVSVTQPTCSVGTGIVAFSALPSTGVWVINPGNIAGTGTTYTGNFAPGTYSFTVTNASGCVSPAAAAVTITAIVSSVTVAATQTFCSGATTVNNLVATGTGTINWYNVSTGGSILNSATPLVSGTYYVSQTVTGCESARTATVVTANVTTPTASAQTFCNGTPTVAGLQATGTGTIKWYATNVSTPALTSGTNLVSGTNNYYATQTLNGCESARVPVSVIFNTTAAPTASAQTFCSGVSAVSNLVVTGTGSINWYNVSTGGASLPSATALTTGVNNYYVTQTLNGCESARTLVAVTVNTTVAPTASSSVFCATGTPTIANLVSTVTGTSVQCYALAAGGSALTSGTALSTGIYYVSQKVNTCESTRTLVAVTVNAVVAPTAVAPSAFCAANMPTVAGLTPSATGAAIQWYMTSGPVLTSDTQLSAGTNNYYATQTINGCEGPKSTAVSVIVNVSATPTLGTVTLPTCTVATGSFTIANYDSSYTYAFVPSTGVTNTAGMVTAPEGSYTVTATKASCASAPANVVVNGPQATPAPTGDALQAFISNTPISDIVVSLLNGGTVQWYASQSDAESNINAIDANAFLQTGSTYYAVQTVGGCRSASELAVTISAPLGVGQFNMASMKYYPNPVIDVLNIVHTDVISSIEVFNLLGQKVMSSRPNALTTTVDMGNLSEGTYLVQVKSGDLTKTVKVVKNQK